MGTTGGRATPAWFWFVPLVLLAAASRVPQLASPHLIIDGDEAVVGLMARHLLDGRQWPWFFYGQPYGLSTVEAVAAAVGYAVAGFGAVALKVSMLVLWLAGVLAHQRALARLIGDKASTRAMALLVLMPAWAVWSMKARGGYLTAFAATGFALWLLVRLIEGRRDAADHTAPGVGVWTMVGVLAGVIFLTQRLWLPGLVPIVAAALWFERRRMAGLLGAAAGVGAVMAVVKAGSDVPWLLLLSSPRGRNPDPLESAATLGERFHTAFTGSYYLWVPIEPGPVTAALAVATGALLAALLALQVYRMATKQWHPWSHGCAVAIVLTLGATWLLAGAFEPRYFLPIVAWLWCWAGIEATDFAGQGTLANRGLTIVTGVLLALGAVSCVEFYGYSYLWPRGVPEADEQAALEQVLDHLRERDVRHVFATNGLLQWQIPFYSSEAIVARYYADRDRYQAYVTAADEALDAGAPVAIVGYARSVPQLDVLIDRSALLVVEGRYFVYVGPDETLLRRQGFRFYKDRR